MHSDFVLIDEAGSEAGRWSRLPLGDTHGRNEAWLRDTILRSPGLMPLKDIDPSFGPLVPLCTELRTDAGPLDAAFVSPEGKLTLVECKLWRNPQARREVVAQILDYARALQRWSYSDLQRQVSARLGQHGNVPFARVSAAYPDVSEAEFTDGLTRSLRAGRFLLIIMGDGIREDVESIAELINRNAAAAFQLAIVEAALYGSGDKRVAVQTRVRAKTRLIERHVVLLPEGLGGGAAMHEPMEDKTPAVSERRRPNEAIWDWWEPVVRMTFDDPDQPQPVHVNNYVRASLPWPRVFLGAYRLVKGDTTSVYLGGPQEDRRLMMSALDGDVTIVASEIPGAEVQLGADGAPVGIHVPMRSSDFPSDDAHRAWIIETMNAFANAIRPRLKHLVASSV